MSDITAGQLLVEARQRAGMTQQVLARLAATSQSAIAAYEAGARQPTLPVLQRTIRAAGMRLVIDLAPRDDVMRLFDIAEAIRDEPDERNQLRLVFEFLRGATEAQDELGLLIAAEPPPTGDRRYDTLLAAVAEHLAIHADLPVPAWTREAGRTIDGAWWISDLPSARVFALAHTPSSFRARGVFVDRRDLEAA